MSMIRSQKRESGQSAVLIALLMIVLTVIIAFTTNLGTIATERMVLQNAADLSAFSAAATQAGELNKLRERNQQIWQTLKLARQTMEPSQYAIFPLWWDGTADCSCPARAAAQVLTAPAAEGVIAGYRATVEGLSGVYIAQNLAANLKVRSAATDGANANLQGSGNKLDPITTNLSAPPGAPLFAAKQDKVDVSYHGWCIFQCGPVGPIPIRALQVKNHELKSWFYRDTSRSGETIFVSGIKDATFQNKLLDTGVVNSYFSGKCGIGSSEGGNGRCTMSAYAAAHPHHGKMGAIKDGVNFQQRETMWKVPGIGLSDPLPFNIDRASNLDPAEIIRGSGQMRDYKVRFVGIFEDSAQFVNGGQNLKNGVLPFGSMMDH